MSTGKGAGEPVIGRIARAGSANLIAAGIGAVANLVIVIVVTRNWPQSLAGAFFAVTSIFLLALSLVELGVDQGFVRFQARNIAMGRHSASRRIIRVGMLSVLGTSSVAATLLVIFSGPIGAVVADSGTAVAASTMTQVVALSLPFAAMYDLLLALTRGHSQMRPTIVIERICRPVAQVAFLVLALLAGSSDPKILAGAWVAPYLGGFVLAGLAVRRLPQPPAAGLQEGGTAVIADFWSFTAPRGVARFFQAGLQRADIALVSALAGPAASAVYTAATRFLVVGQVATQALQQVSEPHLARLIALEENRAVKEVFRQLTLWSVTMTWPIYLLVAIFAEPLLTLVFGEEYAVGGLALTILALTMLFATAMGPLDVLLLMAGRSGLSLMNTGAALVIDLAGCLLLVPSFGIEGASLAWAAAIVGRNLLGIIQVARHLHIGPANAAVVRRGVACIALFGALPLVPRILAGSQAWTVTVAIVVIPIYALLLSRAPDIRALLTSYRRRGPTPMER